MLSLTYLSSATEPFSREQLEELLAQARPKNERLGVTGMMLYAGGNFIQTLEGEEDAVTDLYSTIEKDQRHREIMIMLREKVKERSFPDWSMGFEMVSDEEAAKIPGFNSWLQTDKSSHGSFQHSRAGIFYRLFSDYPR
ncbi:BLUF domain-containing protein [Nocardioides sp. CFH 31398]|uniref:BLUF domain-containing protein n=1 Tax=Nocardioides sp. CFH 31398 TaxID=2919579 RepID=UPI001F0515C5|nr:BLUF domain-containing protein [Nocardioides sp. CFH 31398]MCH1867118.1 BLUF domain-containing protein [Nocardioides sp. CFH 31398]